MFNPKKEITPEQIEYIKANYATVNDADMGKHLSVSASKIYSWCRELNLPQRGGKCSKINRDAEEVCFSWNRNYWPFN